MPEVSEASVADLFIDAHASKSARHLVEWSTAQRVIAKLRSAASHRFVLDTEASIRLAEVVRDCPELLAEHQQFARAPYDVTWVEFDFRSFYRTRNSNVPAHLWNADDPTGDQRMGYLIDHDDVYVVSTGFNGTEGQSERASLVPLCYHLHTEWRVEDQLEFCRQVGTSRAQLDHFFWGGTLFERGVACPEVFDDVPEGWLRSLRAENAVSVLPLVPVMRQHTRKGMFRLIDGGSGELRNIIGTLLLLNRPGLTHYVREVGARQTFRKGKLRRYLSHTVVTIPTDPRPVVRKLYSGGGDSRNAPRRHEVRGTYCHDEQARKGSHIGCAHDWQVLPDARQDRLGRPAQWECGLCHGKRWWRDAHLRGDAGDGFNTKHYEVVGSAA